MITWKGRCLRSLYRKFPRRHPSTILRDPQSRQAAGKVRFEVRLTRRPRRAWFLSSHGSAFGSCRPTFLGGSMEERPAAKRALLLPQSLAAHRLHPHSAFRIVGRRPGCGLIASPSCCLLAAKDHASGSRFRDQPLLLVGDGALYVADCATPPHDYSFRFELCLPDRAEEIDFQFNRSEGFLRSESTCKRHAHRCISNVA